MKASYSEQIHREIVDHLFDLRTALDTATLALTDMLAVIDREHLQFGTDEANDAMLEIAADLVKSLRTLAWITDGDGTREMPLLETFSHDTWDILKFHHRRIQAIYKAQREA